MAVHRRIVLALWVLMLSACALSYPILESRLQAPVFAVEHAESSEVHRLLVQHFPGLGVEQDLIVFNSRDRTVDSPQYRVVMDRAIDAAAATAGVEVVIGPYQGNPSAQISQDRHTAFATVGINGDGAERSGVARELQAAVGNTSAEGVEVGFTGYTPIQNDAVVAETTDLKRAEAIGIPMAFVLLILAFGALFAALVPVAVAVAGILLSFGTLLALSTAMTFDSLVISISTMICTGIGIDYAMFIISRFREELARRGVRSRRERVQIAEAVGAALDTAGKTVLASGIIVMISLGALAVVRVPIFRGIAIGVIAAVVSALLVALTLLPALLATLGPAINRGNLPACMWPADTRPGADSTTGRWARWAHAVMRRPLIFGGFAAAILVLAALPITGIRYGLDWGTSALNDTPSGHSFEVLADKFEPGLLAPIEIVATGRDDTPLDDHGSLRASEFIRNLSTEDRISAVTPQYLDGRMRATAIPSVPGDSIAANELIEDLRSRASAVAASGGPCIKVGGATAESVDASHEITLKLPLVVALVLGSSLIFLIVVFRCLVLPIKAIIMNLMATGAALGITVAIFQWGIGESFLDFHSTGFLQVFLPATVFAVLYGLSMDYEVFLIRRMKEQWDGGYDNQAAVASGVEHTARPITAAAAIMIVVFGSFVTADVLELKQIGFALAVAILIDAVIVRLVMVPAFMRLFGRWNWWLPTIRRNPA
jgi:putative drug exporter of the RND superfamily